MLCKARSTAFWGLEIIKRGETQKTYQLLKEFDIVDSKSEKLDKYHKLALLQLLDHATTTTEFYGAKKGNRYNLSDFPITNKNIIKQRQKEFMSNKYEKKSLVTMSTSGSTGTPFICYQNIEKKKRVYAEIIYFSEKAGYKVGERLIFLRALTDKSKKPKLRQWIQNEVLVDISNLKDENIDKLLLKIEEESSLRGSTILAYASTYDALKDYIIKKGKVEITKGKIKGIISSSEILFDETRLSMSRFFKCPCFSRYANQENGVLGQDSPNHPNTFILNEAHYFFEILKFETDEPVENGEVGRIIVTDLYNYAMPMIRYDTGDVGAFTYVLQNGVRKKAITNFGGRKVDVVFDTFGNRISPHMITNNFWSFPEISQFQFIQQSKTEYTVKINVCRDFVREKEMIELLQKLLGNNAIINIEMVQGIPVLSSGKRKYIVNKMFGSK